LNWREGSERDFQEQTNMADGELIDAREAMNLLGIGENELQTYVARGDLRAFRSAGTMKFRREDVVALKGDKGTEPTIIIPAADQKRKPGQSGILSAVPGSPSTTGSGLRAAKPTDATDQIVFDDIELMPTEDALTTQQATVVGTAVQKPVTGEATVVEPSAAQTGEMTVVDEAGRSTGPAAPVSTTGSGRRPAAPVQTGSRVGAGVGPAVSRVRQPSVAVGRRTATVYEKKTAHPIMTTILVLTACVLIFTASLFGVMSFKGHYDWDQFNETGSKERIIPPYLTSEHGLGVYEGSFSGSLFGRLPGMPQDDKPEGEPDPSKSPEPPQ
jgi:hypothetical protein